jgi:hypothetical protein
MRDALFQRAYHSTRNLLVPCHQQLQGYDYPRIVLLRSLDDIETASDWRTTSGDLMWDKLHGYRLFHIEYTGINGGSSVVRLQVSVWTLLTDCSFFGSDARRFKSSYTISSDSSVRSDLSRFMSTSAIVPGRTNGLKSAMRQTQCSHSVWRG